MNRLFDAIDNLFESQTPVILSERGSKYLKDIDPNDDTEASDWDKRNGYAKDKIDDRGVKTSREDRSRRNPAAERYFYDVIKHLEPEGYYFTLENNRYNGFYINMFPNGSDKNGVKLANVELTIDANDNPTATVTKNNSYDGNVFGKKASLKDVAREVAKEKGVTLNDDNYDEFMIDNGAEIKDRYSKIDSTGSLDDIVNKIQQQFDKLPKGGLLRAIRKNESETFKNSETLTEDWDPSMPNWLKTMAIKGKKSWAAPQLQSTTKFKTLSKDELKNITKMAKQAEADGQLLFVRLGNSAFWYHDRRWRQCLDYDNQRSEADMMSAIENEYNKASGCITLNYKDANTGAGNIQQDRKTNREGSVERYPDKAGYDGYQGKFDKSGYRIDPSKYTEMLKKIRSERLVSSSTIQELNKEDFVNRFNELGAKAKDIIANSIDISFQDGDKYDSYKIDTSKVTEIQKAAEVANNVIKELFRKIDYLTTNDESKLGYYSKPSDTDIEGWINNQINKVNDRLDDFEALLTSTSTNESVELKESTNDECVTMECHRDGYTAGQVQNNSLSVGELIEILSGFDSDMQIVTSHDDGYTYGPIYSEDFNVVSTADDDDDEEYDESENLNEAEYTPNARKCIDAANLLGQIDLSDVEDAAKIKDSIDKLFDKLVRLAPRIDKREKKEQKEIEEASSNEDSELVKAAKANMEEIKKNPINPENKDELNDKAKEVVKAMSMKEKYEIGKKYYEAYSKAGSAEKFLNECGQDLQDIKNMRYFKYVMKDKGKNEDLHSVIECMKSVK